MHDKKFDPKGKARFDRPGREKLYDIPELFEFMELDENQYVLDIGAGTGFFSTRMAEVVGEGGKIFAIDISQDMLDSIEEKIAEMQISNINTVLSIEDRIELPAGLADLAFMSSVLHELDGDDTLKEAHRILKVGGKLAIQDWKKKREIEGPPYWHRLSQADAIKKCESVGFKHMRSFSPRDNFYGLLFERI